MLLLGRRVGWRAMRLCFSRHTLRLMEKFLYDDVHCTQYWPEYGADSGKCTALNEWRESGGNFWKRVNGEIPVDDRAGYYP